MKKLVIPAMALMVALASCSKPTPATDSAQTSVVDSLGEANKALIKKCMNAVLTGDTVTLATTLAEGYMQHGPSLKDSTNKKQDLAAWSKNWKETFRSLKYDEAAVLAETIKPETNPRNAGDWVLTWGTISADYKNGMPSVKFALHLAFHVTNGMIDKEYVYYNVADILTQQGFAFVPPKKDAKK